MGASGTVNSGVCAGTGSITISSSGNTPFTDDTVTGDEEISVYCNSDGTVNVYYSDDTATPFTDTLINASGVVITCSA